MPCRLDEFNIKTWKTIQHRGHVVEVASATTKLLNLDGVLYKLDGVFQGFVGTEDAALWHVDQELNKPTLKAYIEITRDRELTKCYEASICDEEKSVEIAVLSGYRIRDLEREIKRTYPGIEIERENF